VKLIMVLWLLLVGLTGMEDEGQPERGNPAQQVQVKARRFKFVPSRINMKAGTTIEIVLTSQDVTHGFRIVGTDTDVRIPPRGEGKAKVTFQAEKPGWYRFECSRPCGAGHASMRGVIRVVPSSSTVHGPGFKE